MSSASSVYRSAVLDCLTSGDSVGDDVRKLQHGRDDGSEGSESSSCSTVQARTVCPAEARNDGNRNQGAQARSLKERPYLYSMPLDPLFLLPIVNPTCPTLLRWTKCVEREFSRTVPPVPDVVAPSKQLTELSHYEFFNQARISARSHVIDPSDGIRRPVIETETSLGLCAASLFTWFEIRSIRDSDGITSDHADYHTSVDKNHLQKMSPPAYDTNGTVNKKLNGQSVVGELQKLEARHVRL